jgi:hypothetical protein
MPEIVKTGRGWWREPGAMVRWKAEINRRFLAQAPSLAAAMIAYKIEERGGRAEIETAKDHHATMANDIAMAAKLNRKARKAARNAPRSR